ncbi:leucine-rich repeat protein [Porcipelethomonas sp.]|uniref:leucine-rich repeat protein n=1 Tax=Porcipelethomonas sp. TaxID=2981675 RepID=UPI003EF5BE96
MNIKKVLSCFFSLMIISLFDFSVYAGNQIGNYTYKNFTYNINSNDTVSIISCDADTVMASIPDKINDMPVVNINSEAFSRCSKLEKIIVNSDNQYFTVMDGILFSKDRTKLIKCPPGMGLKSYYIPDGTGTICPGAFSACEELELVSVPASVYSIGDKAFADTGFTSITISNKSASLGEMALGFSDEKTVDNFTVYGYIGSSAEEYASANGLNFISIDCSIYNVRVNGNLYYYTEQKNFSGWNIVVTDTSGNPVTYAFSSSPAAVYKKYGSALSKVDILDTSGAAIASVNVRTSVKGDANQDGTCNIRDAAFISSKVAKRYSFTGFEAFCADKNGDGTANVRDAAAIAREAAQKYSDSTT